jgi:hypothetical protein
MRTVILGLVCAWLSVGLAVAAGPVKTGDAEMDARIARAYPSLTAEQRGLVDAHAYRHTRMAWHDPIDPGMLTAGAIFGVPVVIGAVAFAAGSLFVGVPLLLAGGAGLLVVGPHILGYGLEGIFTLNGRRREALDAIQRVLDAHAGGSGARAVTGNRPVSLLGVAGHEVP